MEREAPPAGATATRKDLQLGRRGIHMLNGCVVATAYALLFTHEQVVRIFGTIACVVYVLDRVRIHYPDLAARVPTLNRAFFRAEEQVRESAMVPYAVAILLTILTFPKPLALVAIYVLAIADPLSAVVGIRFGRTRVVPEKTVEGSAAFLLAAFLVILGVFRETAVIAPGRVVSAALLLALLSAVFEMLPLRIDDNLTIPLFVGFAGWIVAAAFGLPLV